MALVDAVRHCATKAPARQLGSLIVAVGLIAVLTGCSGKGTSASAGGNAVTIHATDFRFTKGVPQILAAGKVHIVLANDSKSMLHELWLYPQQQPRLQEMLSAKRNGDDVSEEDFLQGVAGKVEDLPAGKSAGFDATLGPGTYEIACFQVATINGQKMVHYDMGMHASFSVR